MKTKKKFTKKIAASLLLATGVSCSSVFAAELDILFFYDDHTNERFNNSTQTALENWVDQINNFYTTSQVDLSLRLVGAIHYNVNGNTMDDVLENAHSDGWIKDKRNEFGADFVSVIHETGECGIGYMAVDSEWAYNVIGADCGNAEVLAHELGHNMGLNHSRAQGDTKGSLYDYALGHGVNNSFGTIMTYAWIFNAPSAAVFSNPNLNCNGYPCGVEVGEPEEAYAAKALNNVKGKLADFRPTRVIDEPDEDDSSDDNSSDDNSSDDNTDTNQGENIALYASASTSFVSDWETLSAVNDGSTPLHSNDKSNGAYGNWDSPDTYQWVHYDWPSMVTLSSSEVYWFDDDGGVLVPTVAFLQYWDGASWVDAGDVPLVEDAFNVTALDGITTTNLRIIMKNDYQSTGILEWRVISAQ